MRIDDLVSQGTLGQVRSLRDVEDLVDCGFVDAAAKYRPKLSKNTEERGLSATVRASDKEMHAWLDTEVH